MVGPLLSVSRRYPDLRLGHEYTNPYNIRRLFLNVVQRSIIGVKMRAPVTRENGSYNVFTKDMFCLISKDLNLHQLFKR